MNPLVKRALAVVAVKQAYDKVQEMRRPKKPSLLSRISPVAMLGALGGALFYLGKSGRLRPVVDQVRGKAGRGETDWEPPEPVGHPVGDAAGASTTDSTIA